MMSQEPFTALATLARRLRNDPRYMAYVLAIYQQQEGLMDDDLAEALGTLPSLVSRLALCKRPDASSSQFAEQVRELADYTLTDEVQLAGILRQVAAIEKLAGRPTAIEEQGAEARRDYSPTGLLAAARDRYEQNDDAAAHQDEEAEPED